MAGWSGICLAQPAPATADSAKKEALEWLDAFSRRQVLFHSDDVKKLRARVAAMSEEEAAAWWQESEPKRRVLASPEWAETESWLRQFLAVQAIYSDEEIRYFQSQAADQAKASASSLQEVLDRLTALRRRFTGRSQAAEQTRQLKLAANQAYRQADVRRREESLRQASARPAATFPAPPPPRERPSRLHEPLVDSLDVARWTVLQQLFPRW
ncbi:MAG: hypothetical protein J5I93_03550 [Pirellulaceae bacterium]|nr:hypothetical protein [Pirellulaceae bacterium]